MATFLYDGRMSGALMVTALGDAYALSGQDVKVIPYANGMRCIIIATGG